LIPDAGAFSIGIRYPVTGVKNFFSLRFSIFFF
jgi:hypothetical protein